MSKMIESIDEKIQGYINQLPETIQTTNSTLTVHTVQAIEILSKARANLIGQEEGWKL